MLKVATALVASTIASAAVITGMIAVMHGGEANLKELFQLLDGGRLKESGKVVPITRVTRASSDQLAITRSGAARPGLEAFAAVISCNCFVRLF